LDLIVYHNACPDGFTAAYIAKLKYPQAKLLARDHGLEPPYEEVTGKDVLVVDFSWRTREQNDKLASLAKSFKILDHHKTAEAVLAGADYAVFDMNRSGAGLAWDYLFGQDGGNFNAWDWRRPWWVDYVEDRDLWTHRLPETDSVNAYIMTTAYDLESWKAMTQVNFNEAVEKGKAIRLEIDKYIREVVKQVQVGNLNVANKKYSVGVVNVPYLHTSDIGNVLAHRYDIGMGWFERGDSLMQFSLRSIGDIDVSEVAKIFNGGGHKNAAGFQLPIPEGRRIVDQILNRLHLTEFLLL
jgi:oligoribonuclease NrnB/cAMP/cGMP phosphodiesterase (DHH superfamily)